MRPTLTSMSRLWGLGRRPPTHNTPPVAHLGRWIGACIALLSSGCFYFLPLVPVEENVPPEFVRASHTPGSDVVLDDRGAVVYIVVSDVDNAAELSFTWDLTGEGILSGAQTIPDGNTRRASQLRLDPEARYDGAMLTVTANDGSGTPVTVSWPVALIEGGLQ